jgi:hypothetical protein
MPRVRLARPKCGEGLPDWAVYREFNHSHLLAFPFPLRLPIDDFYTADDGARYPTRQECNRQGRGPQNQASLQAGAAYVRAREPFEPPSCRHARRLSQHA